MADFRYEVVLPKRIPYERFPTRKKVNGHTVDGFNAEFCGEIKLRLEKLKQDYQKRAAATKIDRTRHKFGRLEELANALYEEIKQDDQEHFISFSYDDVIGHIPKPYRASFEQLSISDKTGTEPKKLSPATLKGKIFDIINSMEIVSEKDGRRHKFEVIYEKADGLEYGYIQQRY